MLSLPGGEAELEATRPVERRFLVQKETAPVRRSDPDTAVACSSPRGRGWPHRLNTLNPRPSERPRPNSEPMPPEASRRQSRRPSAGH